MIDKGLTIRGARQHGQRYIPMLLDRLAAGELSTSHPATHTVSLEEAPRAYEMFNEKGDGCVRAVIRPGGWPGAELARSVTMDASAAGSPPCGGRSGRRSGQHPRRRAARTNLAALRSVRSQHNRRPFSARPQHNG